MLIDIIKKIQSDIDSDQEKLELIKIFTPLINSYKSKFYSDDITSELIIKILLIAKKINIDGFMLKEHNSEDINKKIFSYFQNAIHNKYVDLVKAILSEKSILYKDYIIPEVIDPYEHIIANDYIMNLLNQLSKNQKKLLLKYT